MIKMVAFDLDGTVCDSIPLCIEAFRKAASVYTGGMLTEQEIVNTFGLNEAGMMKAIVKTDWENALKDFYGYYEKMHDMCAAPFDGIHGLITYLKGNHIIVPLVTGKGERSCGITLGKIGLDDVFDKILTGSETHLNKGELILSLLSEYSVKKEEFFYVGDAISDLETCNAIGVTCLSAAWGTNSSLPELKIRNPQFTFESVSSLEGFLKSELVR